MFQDIPQPIPYVGSKVNVFDIDVPDSGLRNPGEQVI
jgi:hypothetical protein